MRNQLLEISSDAEGIFKSRENRFLGKVKISEASSVEEVHIRDPGRLEEILYPGNEVLLERAEGTNRKTGWTLLAGKLDGKWIFINSGYHRKLSEKILGDPDMSPFGKLDDYQAEVNLGNSRIDFLLNKDGKDIWLEVKGCTLAEDDIALFPDAPTERGRKHVEELAKKIDKEDKTDIAGALLFLVFRSDAECFKPYTEKDPEFARIFEDALKNGLDVYPVKLEYDGKNVYHLEEISLCEPFDSQL